MIANSQEDGRSRLRSRLLPIALFGAGLTLWGSYEAYWRLIKPGQLQQQLFGSTIAGPLALHSIARGCCSYDGGGANSWTYFVPSDKQTALVQRCRNADGTPKRFKDVRTPYFDQLHNACVVARRYDARRGEDLTAEVANGQLKIVQFLF